MHVLIIPSWYPSAPSDIRGSFFREQAIALCKSGCQVGVIYPELRSLKNWRSIFSGKKNISTELDEGVMTYRSHGMNWIPRLALTVSQIFLWHGMRLYRRYVAERGVPDVIHVHSMLYAGLVATAINRKYGIPFVITEHSSAFVRNLVSPKGLQIARKIALFANGKFAVSEEFANKLNILISPDSPNWGVIPNIVNPEFLDYEIKLRKDFDYLRFINVALMTENKGQANLLYALSELIKKKKNVHLTLVGDGLVRKDLEMLVEKLKISNAVTFTGKLSRDGVLSEIANSDCFILSSRYETFGVVVIEALALGKPVISTECGGPNSIVRDTDGILVPTDNVQALVCAMERMIDHYCAYSPQEIRQSCQDRFGEKSICLKLIRTYNSILNNGSIKVNSQK